MNLKIFAALIILFKAFDVIITKYALDNNLMQEMNPFYGPSLVHQVPVILAVIMMTGMWIRKDQKIAKFLMVFFTLGFSFPVINNLIIINL